MEITAADEPIHAGWLTVELKTMADVEQFNTSEFRDKFDEVFEGRGYESPRFDDDMKLPYLEVVEKDGAMYVLYREDGYYETDRAPLPALVSIWSYDMNVVSLEAVE